MKEGGHYSSVVISYPDTLRAHFVCVVALLHGTASYCVQSVLPYEFYLMCLFCTTLTHICTVFSNCDRLHCATLQDNDTMPKKSVRSVLTIASNNKQEVKVCLSANAPATSWWVYYSNYMQYDVIVEAHATVCIQLQWCWAHHVATLSAYEVVAISFFLAFLWWRRLALIGTWLGGMQHGTIPTTYILLYYLALNHFSCLVKLQIYSVGGRWRVCNTIVSSLKYSNNWNGRFIPPAIYEKGT